MERIIGRKKIEEIRNSLRVPITTIETHIDSYDIPDFNFYITETKKNSRISENKDLLNLTKSKQFTDMLSLFNEFCPCVKFSLQKDLGENLVIAEFGNEKLTMLLNKYSEIISIYDSKSIRITHLRNYFKEIKVRNSIEYSILNTALKKQYEINT